MCILEYVVSCLLILIWALQVPIAVIFAALLVVAAVAAIMMYGALVLLRFSAGAALIAVQRLRVADERSNKPKRSKYEYYW